MSRRRLPILTSLLVAAAIVVGAPSSSDASTFIKLGLQSLTVNADRVVVARVTEIDSKRRGGRIVTDVELQVLNQWKGPSDASGTITVRKPGGRIGDVATRVHGMPSFRESEKTLLFIESSGGERPYSVTGLRQGKFRVVERGDEDIEYAVPDLEGVQLLEPKPDATAGSDEPTRPEDLDKFDADELQRTQAAPIHRKARPLDDLRSRVRAIVNGDAASP